MGKGTDEVEGKGGGSEEAGEVAPGTVSHGWEREQTRLKEREEEAGEVTPGTVSHGWEGEQTRLKDREEEARRREK